MIRTRYGFEIDESKLVRRGVAAPVERAVKSALVNGLRDRGQVSVRSATAKDRDGSVERSGVGNPAASPFRSKLESAYAGYLHTLMLAGDIQLYRYEPIKLLLAPQTTFTPDFFVQTKEGTIEFHEVKGWAREDAMVKLKVAAKLYPWWKFWLIKRYCGAWDLREVPSAS